MKPCPWPVADLLPHQPPMVLLERVLGYDDTMVVATAHRGPDNPFITPNGLPAHVGVELMAQTCGAWVGAHALANGGPVNLGYLLGTRHYLAETEWFACDRQIEVTASVVLRDQGMGVFDCTIAIDGRTVATAQLMLFQPEEEA